VSDQQIRPRAEDDLEDLVTILAEVHLRDHFPMNWPEQPAQWVRRASGLGAWVAELDGRLVGHVGLSSSDGLAWQQRVVAVVGWRSGTLAWQALGGLRWVERPASARWF